MKILSLEGLLKKIETMREKAKIAIERTKEIMKRQYNKRTCQSQGLKTEEQVQLEARNIQTNQPSKKLDQKRYGPFTIKEKIRQGAYRLELPEGWAIYNVFNEDLLICCKKAEFTSQYNVRFDSKKGILLGGLSLNSELCLLLHLPLLGFKRFIKREKDRDIS